MKEKLFRVAFIIVCMLLFVVAMDCYVCHKAINDSRANVLDTTNVYERVQL